MRAKAHRLKTFTRWKAGGYRRLSSGQGSRQERSGHPSSRLRWPPPERSDCPGKPTARPRPPRLDLRIRAGVLLDPEQEREEQEKHREDDQEVERPSWDRLLHAECGVGQDPVDAVHSQEAGEHREVDAPAAVREIARIRRRDLGGLPLRAGEEAERHHPESSRIAADIPIELEPEPQEITGLGENRPVGHLAAIGGGQDCGLEEPGESWLDRGIRPVPLAAPTLLNLRERVWPRAVDRSALVDCGISVDAYVQTDIRDIA